MNNEIELFDWENLTILNNFNKNLHSIISTVYNNNNNKSGEFTLLGISWLQWV